VRSGRRQNILHHRPANCMRLILHCAAYVLHQQLRVHALSHTGLAAAQPNTVILKLF